MAKDPATFSNAVSRHLQLPNGLDGDEHAKFRKLLDIYLADDVVAELAPTFHRVAESVLEDPQLVGSPDALAREYSVRAMQAWLGWPEDLRERLLDWVDESGKAARSGDRAWNARMAEDFDHLISLALEGTPSDSVTARLSRDHDLSHPEVVSILRNWTAGDLRSMAQCLGVIMVALAGDENLQERFRAGMPREEFTQYVDEVLREDDPFVSNRRITTCPARVGDEQVEQGQVVHLNWTAANVDPSTFHGFDPAAHASKNLVWGVGPHFCPGKPLSMAELSAFLEVLLAKFTIVASDDGARDVAGGWAEIPVSLQAR